MTKVSGLVIALFDYSLSYENKILKDNNSPCSVAFHEQNLNCVKLILNIDFLWEKSITIIIFTPYWKTIFDQ